jgi:transposase
VRLKSTPFGEDALGYLKLFELLGGPVDTIIAMEATGHYWKNLFAALVARGFSVALLNPLRTRRFAEEDLERTKTDSIDALGIARIRCSSSRPWMGKAIREVPYRTETATTDFASSGRLTRDGALRRMGEKS